MHRAARRGMTLLEVALSLIVIGTAGVSLLSTVTQDLKFSRQNRWQLIAQRQAQTALDYYARYLGYNTTPIVGPTGLAALGTPPYTRVIPTTEPLLINAEFAALPAGTAKLFVDNWLSTPVGFVFPPTHNGPFEVLRVTVVVSWTPPGGTVKQVRLGTLVSNEGFDKTP